jgi:hypothetical protein
MRTDGVMQAQAEQDKYGNVAFWSTGGPAIGEVWTRQDDGNPVTVVIVSRSTEEEWLRRKIEFGVPTHPIPSARYPGVEYFLVKAE